MYWAVTGTNTAGFPSGCAHILLPVTAQTPVDVQGLQHAYQDRLIVGASKASGELDVDLL